MYKLYVLFLLHILMLNSFVIAESDNADADENKEFDVEKTANVLIDKIKKKIQKPEDIPEVKTWIDDCKKTVGPRAWREISKPPIKCVTRYVNYKKIKAEVEISKERGELDLVFKKYCGRRERIMECADEYLDKVRPCLNDQQEQDLNSTRVAIDAALDFICHENGDRIALFMAEDGIQCVQNRSDDIKQCIKGSIPEVEEAVEDPKSVKIDKFLINDENCEKLNQAHSCIVASAETCDDPTPANILDSLITQALRATPCGLTSSASAVLLRVSHKVSLLIIPHLLILLLAALIAANILL